MVRLNSLIQLDAFPVKIVLPLLLKDKTTGKNIVWGADTYEYLGPYFSAPSQITHKLVTGMNQNMIQPRIRKASKTQAARTKKYAEVFTSAWICCQMNNWLDAEWFGQPGVLIKQTDTQWQLTQSPAVFPPKKTWTRYVDSRRLEITCGEAPYLTSRYDAATGEDLEIGRRIGLLDRKLRVVSENAGDETEWMKWTIRAFQSVYGYEYQGDSLLIARVNLLMTFADAVRSRWKRDPSARELRKIANIIAWNLWQMDGLKGAAPFGGPTADYEQLTMFDKPFLATETSGCKVYDWRKKKSFDYLDIQEGVKTMKWDFCIGNPPYQDETVGDQKNYAAPVYHLFLDRAYQVANAVEMIHPARFLFNAGSTPKAWNEKMLNDVHFKVMDYDANSATYFSNTDIKGGIAITYHNTKKKYEVIGHFIIFPELRNIVSKVAKKTKKKISEIAYAAEVYKFTDAMHADFPDIEAMLSKNHKYDFKTNVLEKLDNIVFFDNKPQDREEYIHIAGLVNAKRVVKWIKRKYIKEARNFNAYKVFVPKANGSGALGEVLSTPLIGQPLIGHTQTFISIGNFSTLMEAENLMKYIKTKFTRCMLGVLKITQDNPPNKWEKVPLQDFTPKSDIDWSQSVADVDRQLYKKYGLSPEEINFIESKIKEMA